MLVFPVLAMARLLLQRHEPSGEKLPLVTALLGRQVAQATGRRGFKPDSLIDDPRLDRNLPPNPLATS
jgi:hypothetical protein